MPALLDCLQQLPDPRVERTRLHRLDDLLFLSVAAVLAGADSFTDIEEFGGARLDWLRRFAPFENGIPSHDTIGRVFALLDPDAFAAAFQTWAAGLRPAAPGAAPGAAPVISLDGKSVRGSHALHQTPLHLVSAFATDEGLVLAQQVADSVAAEQVVVPALLRLLDLRGCLIRLDALHCHAETAAAVTDQGGDYLIGLKANQGTLYDDAVSFCTRHLPAQPHARSLDAEHGRIEERCCWVVPVEERGIIDAPTWPALRAVVCVEARRTRKQPSEGQPEMERRYFVSSRLGPASELLAAVRSHWRIENEVHWVLDVVFGEDQSRVRAGHAGANLALVRKFALNALRWHGGAGSLRRKRKRAGWNTNYLTALVADL